MDSAVTLLQVSGRPIYKAVSFYHALIAGAFSSRWLLEIPS